jgi:GH15 family glucan-1,4-alpha-glucosidase
VLAQTHLNISFRRAQLANKWTSWLQLCQKLMMINLNDKTGRFVWRLTTNDLFTVKSMYEDLMSDHAPFLRKYICKVKILLEIKKSCGL